MGNKCGRLVLYLSMFECPVVMCARTPELVSDDVPTSTDKKKQTLQMYCAGKDSAASYRGRNRA